MSGIKLVTNLKEVNDYQSKLGKSGETIVGGTLMKHPSYDYGGQTSLY